MAIRIGVGVDKSIILSEDGSASYKGGKRDAVISAAACQLQLGHLPEDTSASVSKWLDA
jgi:hypothetical protein